MSDDKMSSELGTLNYWENAYSLELENFKDHGDIGEIWFGRDSSKKVVKCMNELNLCKESDKIIDIGCGNGISLVDFATNGFKKLTGIDYSQKAIDFAREILNDKGFPEIELRVLDMTKCLECPDTFEFKVAHDKGTYDAICLDPSDSTIKRQNYKENVRNILQTGGYFILTSCNWTSDELIKDFNSYFDLRQIIPTKTMTFGGVKGQTISQLVFQKK